MSIYKQKSFFKPKVNSNVNENNMFFDIRKLFGWTAEEVVFETGSSNQSARVAKTGTSYTLGGQTYETYSLKCWLSLTPEATFFGTSIGIIYVSDGDMFVTKNSSNVESVDFNGLGGYTNNPLNMGAMVDDSTNVARSIGGLLYINQDNSLPGLGVEYNGMYIIAADAANLEADIYIDIEFIVNAGAEVEFTIS